MTPQSKLQCTVDVRRIPLKVRVSICVFDLKFDLLKVTFKVLTICFIKKSSNCGSVKILILAVNELKFATLCFIMLVSDIECKVEFAKNIKHSFWNIHTIKFPILNGI